MELFLMEGGLPHVLYTSYALSREQKQPMSVFFNQRQFLVPFIQSLHNWCYVTSLRLILCTFLRNDFFSFEINLVDPCICNVRSLREFGKNPVWQTMNSAMCTLLILRKPVNLQQKITSIAKIDLLKENYGSHFILNTSWKFHGFECLLYE